MKHEYTVKVYHTDTDCYGIVWHGAYLRFCEQARCEFAATTNTPMKYLEDKGICTPLIEAHLKYKHAAKIHDTLLIESTVENLTPIRATMLQKISNKITGQEVAEVTVTFVCTDKNGNLFRKMPEEMYNMMKQLAD